MEADLGGPLQLECEDDLVARHTAYRGVPHHVMEYLNCHSGC
jgi:hypothetical protein